MSNARWMGELWRMVARNQWHDPLQCRAESRRALAREFQPVLRQYTREPRWPNLAKVGVEGSNPFARSKLSVTYQI